MLAALFLVVVPLHGRQQTGVAGRWYWEGASARQQITLILSVEKTKLTGTIQMGRDAKRDKRPLPDSYMRGNVIFKLKNGTIEGNSIRFEQIVSNRLSGPDTKRMPASSPESVVYTGQVDGNTMTLEREVRNDPTRLGSHKVRFTLKRQ